MSTVGVLLVPIINRDSPFAEIQDQRLLEIEMLLQIVRSPVAVHFGKYF